MKRNKCLTKHISCTIAVISMAAIVAGCGNKAVGEGEELEFSDLIVAAVPDDLLEMVDEEPSEFKQRFGVEYSEIPEEFADIPVEVYDTIPLIDDITQEELFAMDIQQIRAFVSVYEPNYRSVYIITEDKVMEDEDWEAVRTLLSYQLYGTIHNATAEGEEIDFEEMAESIKEDFQDSSFSDEDIAELEDQLAYIESLSDEEFAVYMNDLFAEAGYTNEDGSAIDVTEEEGVDFGEVKEALIQSIEVQLGEYQVQDELDSSESSVEELEEEAE